MQEFTQNYFLHTIFRNSLFTCDNISFAKCSVYFMIQYNRDLKTSKRNFISSLYQISIWRINFISGRRDTRNSTINFTRDSFLQRRKICRERAKEKHENRKSGMKTQHAILSTYINATKQEEKRKMKKVSRVIKDLMLEKKNYFCNIRESYAELMIIFACCVMIKEEAREAACLIKSGSRKQTWQREKSTSLTYKRNPT